MDVQPERLSPFLDAFRESWRTGGGRRIRDVLGDFQLLQPIPDPVACQTLLIELIKIDIEQRWKLGGVADAAALTRAEPSNDSDLDATTVIRVRFVEAYLEEIGSTDLNESIVMDLYAHEYRVRHRWGDRPEIDSYADRFEKLSEAGRDQLQSQLVMESSLYSLFQDPAVLDEPIAFPFEGVADIAQANELRGLLAEIRPFSELSQNVRDVMAMRATVRDFAPGEILLTQGEESDGLLVILEGSVEIAVTDADQKHTIARLEKHNVLGEIGLFTRELRSANAEAVTPGRVAVISRKDFEEVAGRYPQLSVAFCELIAERVGTLAIDALWGKRVEHYRIRERLGRGGMGIVYAATDESLQRDVAVKMLRHDLVFDRQASQRFSREAKIVRSLRHPNIVRVRDEFSAYGTNFIVMDLCRGKSLTEFLEERGALPDETVRRIVGQLAAALAHAHAAGVAHRDLKPSNVMVEPNGVIKLTDFGLARGPNSESVGLTMSGQIMGTPRYMAPEQLLGERGDDKSDIYSLGAITLELVTGKPAFQSHRLHELMKERRNWSLPMREAIRDGLDAPLYQFLQNCLSEEPEERTVCLQEQSDWAGPVDWQ